MKKKKCAVANNKFNVLQKPPEIQGSVDLQLTGQPISLSQRPGIGSGRASVRSFSVSGMSQQRSVSAVPSFQSQTELNVGNRFVWERPLSADQSSRRFLTQTKLAPHNFENFDASNKNQSFFTHVKDDAKTKRYLFEKPLSLSSITDDTDQTNISTALHFKSPRPHCVEDLDYQDTFGSTYTLPDMVERTWTEEELIRYCDEVESLHSDDHCQSEMSLGGHILSMAQSQCNTYSLPIDTSQHSNLLRSAPALDSFASTESILSTRLQRVERETDLLLKEFARGTYSTVENSHAIGQFLEGRDYVTHQNMVSQTSFLNETNAAKDVSYGDRVHIKLRDTNCFSHRTVSSYDTCHGGVNSYIQANSSLPTTSRFDHKLKDHRHTDDLLRLQFSSRNRETDVSSATGNVSPLALQLPRSPEQLPLSYRNEISNAPYDAEQSGLTTDLPRESEVLHGPNSDAVETARSINEEHYSSSYQQVSVSSPSMRNHSLYRPTFVADASDYQQMQLVPTKQDTPSQSETVQTSRISASEQSVDNEAANQLGHEGGTSKKIIDESTQRDRENNCMLSNQLSLNNSYSNMLMLIDLDEAEKEPDKFTLANEGAGPSQSTYDELVDVFQDFQPPTTIDSNLSSTVVPAEPEYKHIVNNLIKGADLETSQRQSSIETILLNTAMPSEMDYKQIVNRFLKDADIENVGSIATDPSAADNLSTYHDIVNILNVLELEEKSSRHSNLDSESISRLVTKHSNTSESSQRESQGNASHLSEILTYLDQVDKNSSIVLDNAVNNVKFIQQNSAACGDIRTEMSVKLEDLLAMNVVDLAHMVFTLRFQMEDKSKSVKALKLALQEEREAKQYMENEAEKNMKSRLREQKDHYENAVLRHQKFIDQLISDKKSLTEKVENMVLELKSIEERHVKNLKVVQERHAVEIKRAKDTQAATNKLRMDSWINTKTKKIKEMTVKGLEPELVRMTTSHQQELAEVRQLHQHELKEAELRAARKTETSMELLRHQLVQEKEEAVAKERELFRQRLEKQSEQEEMLYQEHRHRLLNEVKREKQRLQNDLIEAQRDADKATERLKLEYEDAQDADSRRHASEIRKVKEYMEAEREAWARDYKKQKDVEINAREMQYREELRRERDQQIEVVIEKLAEEATQAKADLEQAYNNKMKKLKEQFEMDLKETEESEQTTKTKYNKLKGQITELEDTISELKVQNRQLEKEFKEEQKISEMFSVERSQIKEVVRQEFTSQITSLEQELTRVRAELATMTTKYEVELNTLRTMKDHELQAVYGRVKHTVAQRDATIAELKGKCGQLEGLVEAQRKEYLIK